MAEDTKAVDEQPTDEEFVEWNEDGNRRRGSRYGSAYKEYVLKWLAAEADHKAIVGHPDNQPAPSQETTDDAATGSAHQDPDTPTSEESAPTVDPALAATNDPDAVKAVIERGSRRRGRD